MKSPNERETVIYFIDGTNLCYWLDTTAPTLQVLLELVAALKKEKNCSFYCIFDANTQYKLPQEEREIYQHLLDFKEYFYQVTGGKRADDFILELANSYDAPVISNDNYSDPKYAKYTWKERDFQPKRLFMGEVITVRNDIHLILSELELHIMVSDSVQNAYRKAMRAISGHTTKYKGRVKFYNQQEGWGLLVYDHDIYFQRTALLENIEEGSEVEFSVVGNEKGTFADQIILYASRKEKQNFQTGTIEMYDEQKTMGTIKADTGETLFFYKSYFEGNYGTALTKGLRVEFVMATNKNGPCAKQINIIPIDETKPLKDKIVFLESQIQERDRTVTEWKQRYASMEGRLRSSETKLANLEKNVKEQERQKQQQDQQKQQEPQKQQQDQQKQQEPQKQQQDQQKQQEQHKQQQDQQKQQEQQKQQQDQQKQQEQQKQKQQQEQERQKQEQERQKKQQQEQERQKQQQKQQQQEQLEQQKETRPAVVNNANGSQTVKDNNGKQQNGAQNKNNDDKNRQSGKQNNNSGIKQSQQPQKETLPTVEDTPPPPPNVVVAVETEAAVGQGSKSKKESTKQKQQQQPSPKQGVKEKEKQAATDSKNSKQQQQTPATDAQIEPQSDKAEKDAVANTEAAQVEAKEKQNIAETTNNVPDAKAEHKKGSNKTATENNSKAKQEEKNTDSKQNNKKKSATGTKTTSPKTRQEDKIEAATVTILPLVENDTTKEDSLPPISTTTTVALKTEATPTADIADNLNKETTKLPKMTATNGQNSTTEQQQQQTAIGSTPPAMPKTGAGNGLNAESFDTSIKRRQWWLSLQPQWKKAFNFTLGRGEITDVPDDEGLLKLFSLNKLNYSKAAKNKLSFVLTNLSGLQFLTNLRQLTVSEQGITDLKGLEKLNSLNVLNLNKNNLASLDGIESLTALEEFHCANNGLNLSQLAALKQQLPKLKLLDCRQNQLSDADKKHLKELKFGELKA